MDSRCPNHAVRCPKTVNKYRIIVVIIIIIVVVIINIIVVVVVVVVVVVDITIFKSKLSSCQT